MKANDSRWYTMLHAHICTAAACCMVLHGVVVCCSMLQCVSVSCNVYQDVVDVDRDSSRDSWWKQMSHGALKYCMYICALLQYVAVYCSVAACCSVSQRNTVWTRTYLISLHSCGDSSRQQVSHSDSQYYTYICVRVHSWLLCSHRVELKRVNKWVHALAIIYYMRRAQCAC